MLSRYKQRYTSVSVRFNRSLAVDRETWASKLMQSQTAGHSFLDGDRAEALWIVAFSQPCPR